MWEFLTAAAQGVAATCAHATSAAQLLAMAVVSLRCPQWGWRPQKQEQEEEEEEEEEKEEKKKKKKKEEEAWMHHSDSFHRRNIITKGLRMEVAAAAAGKAQTAGQGEII